MVRCIYKVLWNILTALLNFYTPARCYNVQFRRAFKDYVYTPYVVQLKYLRIALQLPPDLGRLNMNGGRKNISFQTDKYQIYVCWGHKKKKKNDN